MTYNICHPLKSVCLFLNAVANHLDLHDFISPTLTEDLLPKTTRIVFKSEPEDKTRDDALPMVAYSVGELTITPMRPTSVVQGTSNGTMGELLTNIRFTVSTTNEALTAELAFELAQFSMAILKTMQTYDFFIGGITVSEVKRTAGGFFEAVTGLRANCGRPVWQHSNSSDILREIGMALNIV